MRGGGPRREREGNAYAPGQQRDRRRGKTRRQRGADLPGAGFARRRADARARGRAALCTGPPGPGNQRGASNSPAGPADPDSRSTPARAERSANHRQRLRRLPGKSPQTATGPSGKPKGPFQPGRVRRPPTTLPPPTGEPTMNIAVTRFFRPTSALAPFFNNRPVPSSPGVVPYGFDPGRVVTLAQRTASLAPQGSPPRSPAVLPGPTLGKAHTAGRAGRGREPGVLAIAPAALHLPTIPARARFTSPSRVQGLRLVALAQDARAFVPFGGEGGTAAGRAAGGHHGRPGPSPDGSSRKSMWPHARSPPGTLGQSGPGDTGSAANPGSLSRGRLERLDGLEERAAHASLPRPTRETA